MDATLQRGYFRALPFPNVWVIDIQGMESLGRVVEHRAEEVRQTNQGGDAGDTGGGQG